MGRVVKHIFHILKNIRFACSRINLWYLGHGALNNSPTSRATRKKNWEVTLLAGWNNKPQIWSVCIHMIVFSNWCVVCGLLRQDFCVAIFCSLCKEVVALTWLFFQIGGWAVCGLPWKDFCVVIFCIH